jgi:hypothetical protein
MLLTSSDGEYSIAMSGLAIGVCARQAHERMRVTAANASVFKGKVSCEVSYTDAV